MIPRGLDRIAAAHGDELRRHAPLGPRSSGRRRTPGARDRLGRAVVRAGLALMSKEGRRQQGRDVVRIPGVPV